VRMTWAYKTKRDGTLKSRLCVQGCSQIAGVDYDQTHCATLRPGSLRALTALAAGLGLRMRRWDFASAYLQGSLEDGEVVYCSPPPGYADVDEDGNSRLGSDGKPRILRVVKPIYGMAQAGRRWQRSLFPWLLDSKRGFTQLASDKCVFVRTEKRQTPAGERTEHLLVGCYVDDLCVLYSHDDEYSLYREFTTSLTASWEVDDEGDVADLLNIDIAREGRAVVLRQRTYIKKMVKEHLPEGVPNTLPSNQAPADSSLPQLVSDALVSKDKSDPALIKRYQSLVGALLYASTQTRPDIAYSVGMLCRAMSCPTPELYEQAIRVLLYLDKHPEVGLRYEPSASRMYGMSDSDWAVKHSTSGWVFTFMRAAISWGSKKQPVVSLSSCEAEIMAASEAAKEALHLRALLDELGVPTRDEPTHLSMDNQSAIAVAYNPEHHGRMKHVERRHYFVRECVENNQLVVPFVSTHENMADFFTKPLPPKLFFPLRDRIMNVPSS
ncbi:MAG: reverse transcriptase domain-containing protein, partial [Actinomycetota bacterium]|nr:reverse transcriptase domain-containing protein [Actinomycetota bacterium]